MKFARINGSAILVSAKKYKPQDGDVIQCADVCCNAEMIFIAEHEEQGGIMVPDHFRSKRRSDHRDNCPELNYMTEDHANSVSVDTAIEKSLPIILNLNDRDYNWGMPPRMVPTSLTRKDMERQNTPLYQFQQAAMNPQTATRDYAPHAVGCVRDVGRLLQKIEAAGADVAIQNIRATWQQSVFDFDRFYLDQDKQLTEQYWTLQDQAKDKSHGMSSRWKNQDYACGSPKLFSFMPAQKTQLDPITRSNSTSIKMKHPETGDNMIMINRLDFRRASMPIERGRLLSQPCMILAVPRVSSTLLEGATRTFNAGKAGVIWAFTDWMVVGAHQIIPSQDFGSSLTPFRGNQPR